jgi:hypothetical protein
MRREPAWRAAAWRVVVLAAVGAAGVAGCNSVPPPRVQYMGDTFRRKPKPVETMEVYRVGPPPPRFRDLGTVVVTCPSETETDPLFHSTSAVGGCSYEWGVWKACQRAADAGADGIHSIEAAANSGGAIVSLRASVFVRLPPLVAPPPKEDTERPSVEDRLERLDKLKNDQLITPEEYDKKRAEILREL